MDEFVKDNPLQDRHEIERRAHRRLFGVILLPIAFFPLLSLITYNWRDISYLNAPALTPPANLIGLVGAWSVFIGYNIFGLVLWLIPFIGFTNIHPQLPLIMAVVFALIVSTVCCYQGYFAHLRDDSHGAKAVGLATTSAVVLSCVLILVSDYVVTSLLI